jgi:hypothetical protein
LLLAPVQAVEAYVLCLFVGARIGGGGLVEVMGAEVEMKQGRAGQGRQGRAGGLGCGSVWALVRGVRVGRSARRHDVCKHAGPKRRYRRAAQVRQAALSKERRRMAVSCTRGTRVEQAWEWRELGKGRDQDARCGQGRTGRSM